MPKIAIADTLEDWKQLLQAAEPYGDEKGLKVHLEELRESLDEISRLEAYRNELQAKLQEATQQRNAVRAAGKVRAIQVRSILRGVFGPANRRLVQFRVRPTRGTRDGSPASPNLSEAPQ